MSDTQDKGRRDPGAQTSLLWGVLLIVLGIVFLLTTNSQAWFGARFHLGQAWPSIFWALAIAFYIPLFGRDRYSRAGLAIPGTIMLTFGLIFSYNVLSDNWQSWSFMWAFIPVGVGSGMMLAYLIGSRRRSAVFGCCLDRGYRAGISGHIRLNIGRPDR